MSFQRRFLLSVGLTLLAMPGTAQSFTLDQLLDMPFEQLLRLEITSRHPPRLATLRPPWAKAHRTIEHRDAT
jgi:hypothetical protein